MKDVGIGCISIIVFILTLAFVTWVVMLLWSIFAYMIVAVLTLWVLIVVCSSIMSMFK
jgi:hypothetical protein